MGKKERHQDDSSSSKESLSGKRGEKLGDRGDQIKEDGLCCTDKGGSTNIPCCGLNKKALESQSRSLRAKKYRSLNWKNKSKFIINEKDELGSPLGGREI